MSTINDKANHFAASVAIDAPNPHIEGVVRRALATGYAQGYATAAADSARTFQASLPIALREAKAEAWAEGSKATEDEYVDEHGFAVPAPPNPYKKEEDQDV